MCDVLENRERRYPSLGELLVSCRVMTAQTSPGDGSDSLFKEQDRLISAGYALKKGV